jgi:hypothetical protein
MDIQYRLRQAGDELEKAAADIQSAAAAANQVPELRRLAAALASAGTHMKEAGDELDRGGRGV